MLLEREPFEASPRREGTSTCDSDGSAAAVRESLDGGASSSTDSTTPKSGCLKPLPRSATPSLVAKDSNSLTFQWDRLSLQDSFLVEIRQEREVYWSQVYCGEESWTQVQGLKPWSVYAVRVWCTRGETNGKFVSVSDVAMFRTTPARPSVPCAPLLEKKHLRALELKWDEPHELGAAQPVHYSLQIQCPSDGCSLTEGFSEVFAGNTNRFKVGGLAPGRKYRFRLRASNEVGESDWSRISLYTTITQIPRIPECLRVVDATSMDPNRLAVNLEWTCAGNNSADAQLTWYCVELQDMKTRGIWCVCVSSPQAYVGGLNPRWRYCARIRAFDQHESSQWSEACFFKTRALLPGIPSEPRVDDISESSATLTWGPPKSGASVASYLVDVFEISNSSSQGSIMRASYHVHQPGCRLSLLKGGRKYKIDVRANSIEGSGPPVHLHFVSRPSKPQSPSLPYAEQRSATSLNVKWETPKSSEAEPILKYHLEIRRTDVTCTLLDIPDFEIAYEGADPFTKLEGLEPEAVYALRVKAENVSGWSDWSIVAYESTKPHLFEPPDRPAASKCTASSMSLCWDPSLSPDENEIYELESCSILGDDTTSEYSCLYSGRENTFEVNNLASSSEYKFQLRKRRLTAVTSWSEPLVARTAAALPEAPEVFVKCQDFKSITVQWKSSSRLDALCEGSSYSLELGTQYGRKMKWEQVYEGTSTQWTFQGLSWEDTHCVRVAERNAAGQGGPCNPLHIKLQMPQPGKPRQPSFSQLKHTSVRIQWSMPFAEQTVPADSYWLEAAEGQSDYRVVHRGRLPDHIVTSLTPGGLYKFRVCAANAAGQGDYSEPLEVTAPLRNPRPPVDVKVTIVDFQTESSKQRAQVSWLPAEHGEGFAAPDYFVVQAAECSAPPSCNFQNCTTITKSANGTTCCLDGLLCGTSYAVRVRPAAGPEQKLGNWSDSALVSVPSAEKSTSRLLEVKTEGLGWLEDLDEPGSGAIPAATAESTKSSMSSTFGDLSQHKSCSTPTNACVRSESVGRGSRRTDRTDVRLVPRTIVKPVPTGRPRPQKKVSMWKTLKSTNDFVVCVLAVAVAAALALYLTK